MNAFLPVEEQSAEERSEWSKREFGGPGKQTCEDTEILEFLDILWKFKFGEKFHSTDMNIKFRNIIVFTCALAPGLISLFFSSSEDFFFDPQLYA